MGNCNCYKCRQERQEEKTRNYLNGDRSDYTMEEESFGDEESNSSIWNREQERSSFSDMGLSS